MESDLFSEQVADKEIIGSLIQTNRRLWRELEASRAVIQSLKKQRKQGNYMKILQDLQGDFYLAKEYVKLAEEDARDIIRRYEHDIEMAKKFLQAKEAELNPQPLPPAPVDQPQVEQPQVVDPNTGQPIQPAAVDPNAQAAQQLVGDPNQAAQQVVQPQPEQPVLPPLQ